MANTLVAGSVVAKFKSDLGEFRDSLSQAKKGIADIKDTFADTGKFIGDASKQAAFAVGLIAAGAIAFGKSSVDAFAKSQVQMESVNQTLKETARQMQEAKQKIDGTTGSLGKNVASFHDLSRETTKLSQEFIKLGFDDEDTSQAFAKSLSITHNVTESRKDLGLAADFARLKGIGLKEATDVLQLSYMGNARVLKSYGIELDDNAKKTDIQSIIMAKARGQAAAYADTYAGKLDQITVKFNNIKEVVGEFIVSALTPLVDWFNRMIDNQGVYDFIYKIGDAFNALYDLIINGNFTKLFSDIFGVAEDSPVVTMILQVRDAFIKFGQWVSENQEMILTFLKGAAIAFGALAVLGTVLFLINALMNPLVLLMIAAGLLYAAWQTNFWGIRDITQIVIDIVKNIFINLQLWWAQWGDEITTFLVGLWNIFAGVIKIALALILGFIDFFLAASRGDWTAAWDAVAKYTKVLWDGIKQTITGVLDVLRSAIVSFVEMFAGQLDGLWRKASEIAGKIKDALNKISPFNKSSPSLVEYVEMGASKIANTYADLENTIGDMAFKGATMSLAGVGSGEPQAQNQAAPATIVNQNITQNIKDSADAKMVNEQLAYIYRNNL